MTTQAMPASVIAIPAIWPKLNVSPKNIHATSAPITGARLNISMPRRAPMRPNA